MQEDKILTKKGMGSRIYIIVLIGIVLVIIATFFLLHHLYHQVKKNNYKSSWI